MIKIKNLHIKFKKNHVLKGIDFELKKGERVAVIGPSGSGKSTFLRCINRLEEPTSGEIYFKDELVTKKNIREVRKKCGMVFQHFNLIKNMTVMGNLIFAPVKLGMMDEDEAERKAMRLLKQIGLEEKREEYPSKLSGGQQQRIAIIRTLMMEPEVILFDEPTSALDSESIKDVLNLIREVAKTDVTMIIVTHEIGFAKEIATRVVFLDDGKIIEDATAKEFFSHPKTERVKQFLADVI